ncbi:MAG: ComEA family DNA-binding protein [Pseudoxanthomonas suwonensis]|nr:ComEA family DNA-binding protein [Pseudoxanthomonas suwonensis]
METPLKSLKRIFQALALMLAFAGAALATETVNINSADAATLARVLHNIGPSKAEAIVKYRREHGGFRSAEQLAMVRGIGLKTVERNADRIVLEDSRVAPRPAPGHPRPAATSGARQ